ncbi:hypothetical protein K488DRAFT_56969 [Vararia minispora EC-137]|uniref:Uncharacterized protein n=1 Tax=Vararia minispora EC-137 TaxID=1314806 RepID=A0ACB8QC26_9AGAM|nr:hypothetical protein K488DRAFT_56969 [Vararia minispora EC-137]
MPLFENVRFFCAPSLGVDYCIALAQLLTANKGTAVPLSEATHIISSTVDFDGRQEVADGALIVSDLWVQRSLVLGRVMPEKEFSPEHDKLFSGVVACATGLLPQDVEVISAAIEALGGAWRHGLTRDVTHLFAQSSSSDKYKSAMHFQSKTEVCVLVPQWFEDTIRFGYRDIPTAPYEWPAPTVLKSGHARDGIPGATTAQEMRALYKLPKERKDFYRHVLEDMIPDMTKDVWAGRRVLFAPDLGTTEDRLEALEASVVRCGGRIVEWEGDFDAVNVEDFDVLIARYRWGRVYVQAVRDNKLVGSLAWLFHVHGIGAITAPTDQLLHFPIPRKPIENFDQHEITITNYTGPSREYVKRLIDIMGARFTASMSGKNTVVVAGFVFGQKTTKAKNWNIPILNHTWLEDCFVQWRSLPAANDKYIRFPPGLDFARVLGTRGLGRRNVLENVQDVEFEMSQALRMTRGVARGADEVPADEAGVEERIVKATPRKVRRRRTEGVESGEEMMFDIPEEDREPRRVESIRLPPLRPKLKQQQRPVEARSSPLRPKKLGKLGIKTVHNVKECTHLVMNRIARTEKFLCAMAVAPLIVDERWTKACALQRRILRADYRLIDKFNEAKYAFKLSEALERAKENNGRLFEGLVFHLTPRVSVAKDLLRNTIIAHGGKLKPGVPSLRSLQSKEGVCIISCEDDQSVWRPFAEAGHTVYTTEIVLTSALVQQIRWKDPSVVLVAS